MTPSSVLDDAEKRVTAATAAAQTQQRELIEAMRAKWGWEPYHKAEENLPKLEQCIAQTIRPWFKQLNCLGQSMKKPLSDSVDAYVKAMVETCDNAPPTIRRALDRWNKFTLLLGPDGLPDLDASERLLRTIAVDLINGDDRVQRSLEDFKARTDHWIEANNWPATQAAVES